MGTDPSPGSSVVLSPCEVLLFSLSARLLKLLPGWPGEKLSEKRGWAGSESWSSSGHPSSVEWCRCRPLLRNNNTNNFTSCSSSGGDYNYYSLRLKCPP